MRWFFRTVVAGAAAGFGALIGLLALWFWFLLNVAIPLFILRAIWHRFF